MVTHRTAVKMVAGSNLSKVQQVADDYDNDMFIICRIFEDDDD